MKIFIDFDNTIVDTTKAFIEWYNYEYNRNIDYMEIKSYDFTPHIHLSTSEVSDAFTTKRLYEYLECYDGVYDSLYKLKNTLDCELILVTNCSDKSVMRKLEWLEDHKPLSDLFDGKIFLSIKLPYNKSTIDMSDGVLIDDHRNNHLQSNASYKFAYKDSIIRDWYPTQDDGVIVKCKWKDIINEIEKIVCQNNKNIK